MRLNDSADPNTIDILAVAIVGQMLSVIAARRAKGYDIGRDLGGFYARPRGTSTGRTRELRDLATACRKALAGKITNAEWVEAWAALPDRTKTVWKLPLHRNNNSRTIDRNAVIGFGAPGFQIIAPRPQTVAAAIEAALANAKGDRTRKPNLEEAEAIEVIRHAYETITGNRGGRVIAHGRIAGNLNRLGKEIDIIFGTSIYAAVDSVRFRPSARRQKAIRP